MGEAAGVALAARDVGLPVGIGFTVELDGRLPDGTPLADAIEAVDSICAPTHYGVNCAHPTHIERGMADQSPQLRRIAVVRANASELSHAELDEAGVLDDGDPVALAAAVASLRERLPGLRVVGVAAARTRGTWPPCGAFRPDAEPANALVLLFPSDL